MLDTSSALISEFLKDHQQFFRLLYEISKLLENDQIEQARERAAELDIIAGPHIGYEETQLYPRLVELGESSETVETVVGEHREMLNALRLLLRDSPITVEELDTIKAGFRSAFSHAEHCGSLISLISRLSETEQSDSLRKLKQLRKHGKKWTEL